MSFSAYPKIGFTASDGKNAVRTRGKERIVGYLRAIKRM